VLQISRIINETNEMDGVVLGEMQQLMEGPDLFAFIGRVWDTMGQIQDMHAGVSVSKW